MYIVDVGETSVCEYDFLVHVPELCAFFPKHATIPKRNFTIACNTAGSRPKIQKKKSDDKQKPDYLENLDQMLKLIESTYKDSSILGNYKDLIRKASEKLKSHQLDNEISEKTDSNKSYADLLHFLLGSDDSKTKKDEASEENED